MSQSIHSLASFPEELLARILALCVAPRPPHSPRPAWDVSTRQPRGRLAPLLVSRQFLRIASPFFYHTLHLQSAKQVTGVLETLTQYPSLANAVRGIVFGGIWHDCAAVFTLCQRVESIDVCLDSGLGDHNPLHAVFGNGANASDVDAEAFCSALEQRDSIVHLTIRKDPNAYLTHPRPQYVLGRLSRAIHSWPSLESVHIALKMSSSPITLPFAQALSEAPRLQYVRTQLPAIWNELLLVMSSNPSLEKMTLYSESAFGPARSRTPGPPAIKGACNDDYENAILGTGLFMMEAKKHARLSELIRAGTSFIRTRAHTTIATASGQPVSTTPLSASRAKEVANGLLTNHPVTMASSP
ncbi:hypothetical protein BDN67DRAFT_949553 [Paxillus ammoniavirescens]|nr:hypothetical protein BDN67DRAFT_949553 [Paxillus ammoniavirescens]